MVLGAKKKKKTKKTEEPNVSWANEALGSSFVKDFLFLLCFKELVLKNQASRKTAKRNLWKANSK